LNSTPLTYHGATIPSACSNSWLVISSDVGPQSNQRSTPANPLNFQQTPISIDESLLVIARPSWAPGHLERIQAFRAKHDALYNEIVEPHFTLVFTVVGVTARHFITEVELRSAGFYLFEVHLRCATVNKDPFMPMYHTLLVPDEGYSNIVRLHDMRYTGMLHPQLRLDIDFIPHMCIANDPAARRLKPWADLWNAEPFALSSRTHALDVITYRHP
jgi:hypothetical protein